MTEEPYVAEGYHNPILRPTFSSKFLQVYREEEAFPFSSLVADCGGILGMFIGFNFLMVWDCIVWIWLKIKTVKALN